jgi:UDP-glucuronate 4-epimerase
MAVWLFTKAMLAGKPIQVFNHGAMQRDFTFVDDIVAGVTACIERDGLAPYELFNIGNNRPEKLMDLIKTLADALGVVPKLEMLPMQPGDVPATYADISRIRSRLGFEPTTPIATGIPAFVAWYRDHPHLA